MNKVAIVIGCVMIFYIGFLFGHAFAVNQNNDKPIDPFLLYDVHVTIKQNNFK